MAASTISNSGGPGSSTRLSPMTIKVRDKIIEQYADQTLDAINESLKRLLANEEDEQKRLGVLAARVYILRQRISGLSSNGDKAILTAKSPTIANLDAGSVKGDNEWTRLRIIKDCEVNGVRFPKSFIIDVKSADALKLVEAGNAEPVDADAPQMPAAAMAEDDAPAAALESGDDTDDAPASALVNIDEPPAATGTPNTDPENQPDASGSDGDDEETDFIAQLAAQEIPAEDDEDSVDLAESDLAIDGDITAQLDAVAESESEAQAPAPAPPAAEKPETVPVIEAPSAEDVTAALEALGAADDEDGNDRAAAVPEDNAEANIVASAPIDAEADAAPDGDAPGADAEDTSGADAFASATAIAADEIAALLGSAGDELGTDKPTSWFEAQQSAEANDSNDSEEQSGREKDSDDR